MSKKAKFYITTAIDYSNANPHLGHAFEKIGADVIARFKRFMGDDVFYLIGTDEHSQNVKTAAEKASLSPKVYADQMAEKFKQVWSMLEISYTRFIQTTEPIHHEVVSEIITRIHAKDDIYKGVYKGEYCPSCERFLDPEDIDPNKQCVTHGIPVEHIEEENYFFKLSKYQDVLLSHIKKHPEFIRPESRRNEILAFLKKGLKDISMSRQGSDWGVALPFDAEAVVYIWVDALTNYISGLGGLHAPDYERYWPADLHVIGKDITRFHCLIWPAMLMSADIPLPKTIWGHGFVHLKGAKMSKTKGTGVNPVELAGTYGADSLRYYLMREISWEKDGEFLESRLIERHNAELSDGIGNLVSRIHGMINKFFNGTIFVESGACSQVLCGGIIKKFDAYLSAMNTYDMYTALEITHNMIRDINLAIDQTKPWQLAKDPDKKDTLKAHLLETAVSTLITCLSLLPFCPKKMPQAFAGFGLTPEAFAGADGVTQLSALKSITAVKPFSPIFPRLDPKEIEPQA